MAANYSSHGKDAEGVAQAIIDSGGEAISVGADVSKAADITRLHQSLIVSENDTPFQIIHVKDIYSCTPLRCTHARGSKSDILSGTATL